MPVRPNLLERLALYRLKLAPVPLLDVFGAFSFRVLSAGVRLGLFDLLREPASLKTISLRLGVEEGSMRPLLEALAAVGYVEEKADGWTNTSTARRWLAVDDLSGVRSGVEYWARLLEGPLSKLELQLTGQPGRTLYEWLAEDDETADIFQDWMVEITGLAGDEIIRKTKVGNSRTLLDVGGGHGWYSIELCRLNPNMTATILDHPNATRQTPERIESAGLTDRVSVVNDDYMTFAAEEGFDLVLMFNILHGHKTEELSRLLTRSSSWLTAEGRLLILEQFPARSGMARASAALLGLAYDQLLNGQLHTYDDVAALLSEADYSNVNRTNIRKAPGNALIEAIR